MLKTATGQAVINVGSDLYLNPPPPEPAKPLHVQVQMQSDKLELYEKENEGLHAQINELNSKIDELQQAIRTFHSVADTPVKDFTGDATTIAEQLRVWVRDLRTLASHTMPRGQQLLASTVHAIESVSLDITRQLEEDGA